MFEADLIKRLLLAVGFDRGLLLAMARAISILQTGYKEVPLLTAVLLIALAFAIGLMAWIYSENWTGSNSNEFNIIPACFVTGAVLGLPSLYLFIKSEFSLFHPIVFPVWTYIFPAFVVGGVLLSVGLSKPYFLIYLNDPSADLTYSLFLVGLGYLSFAIGALFPVGRNIGSLIQSRLPEWNWSPRETIRPAIFLLAVGFVNTVAGFMYGVLGYQRLEEVGAYDGLVYLTTLLATEAIFLLWLIVFRTSGVTFAQILIIALLTITTLAKAVLAGNRGSLLSSFILVGAAFILARRKVTRKHLVFGGTALFAMVIAGMIYGTTFRAIKESEEKVGFGQYADYVFQTFQLISSENPVATFEKSLESLSERIDALSSLAVVVSNYEALQPYEESYGLEDNIWKDSVTFLIPRPLWPDKPVASDPHRYSELYFNFGENSFAITPIGDLLRNFGVAGVVVGMFFLGLVLRVLYSTLVEHQPFSFWRTTLYFMLLVNVSFESFYGIIIPYMIRVGLVSVLGILIIRIWLGRKSRQLDRLAL